MTLPSKKPSLWNLLEYMGVKGKRTADDFSLHALCTEEKTSGVLVIDFSLLQVL